MNWEEFDEKYGYSGALGAIFSLERTIFRVWAPACSETGVAKVELISYGRNWSPEAEPKEIFQMEQGRRESADNHARNTIGLWELRLEGNQFGLVYTYRVTYEDGHWAETQDPYSIAVIVNGRRSVVVQIGEADFGENLEKADWRLRTPTEAMIEEIHVRDFSISATSGVSEKWRGKFLGLIEDDTVNEHGDKTCFSHLRSFWGFNTIQLMPVFDFASVDETRNDGYNWGYDPMNYNAPEGSYATDPYDPLCRINELKAVIKRMHRADINVVMDVVYNHVYDREASSFEKLVPGYYFRKSTATGCGNDTASEREMFSKFIVDSVTFWAKTYGIDGFRFDLMGCLDVDTMNAVRAALDELDPRILVYGEGWDMPTALPNPKKANQKNLNKMLRIGAFNDAIRNAIKGTEFEKVEPGFVDGLEMRDDLADSAESAEEEKPLETRMIAAMKGSKASFHGLKTPGQMINYVEAHDNLNLNDQLWKNHPKDSAEEHTLRVEIATALNLLAFGIPFMQIGQEFERSKLVNDDWAAAENSYNAGDAVNAINWNLVTEHKNTVKFVERALAARRFADILRSDNFTEISKTMKVKYAKPNSGILVYSVGTRHAKYSIAVNISGRPITVKGYLWTELTNSRIKMPYLEWDDKELSDLSISVFKGGVTHVLD
ncbi:type I pullulanase [Lactovum odontotermitis]